MGSKGCFCRTESQDPKKTQGAAMGDLMLDIPWRKKTLLQGTAKTEVFEKEQTRLKPVLSAWALYKGLMHLDLWTHLNKKCMRQRATGVAYSRLPVQMKYRIWLYTIVCSLKHKHGNAYRHRQSESRDILYLYMLILGVKYTPVQPYPAFHLYKWLYATPLASR